VAVRARGPSGIEISTGWLTPAVARRVMTRVEPLTLGRPIAPAAPDFFEM